MPSRKWRWQSAVPVTGKSSWPSEASLAGGAEGDVADATGAGRDVGGGAGNAAGVVVGRVASQPKTDVRSDAKPTKSERCIFEKALPPHHPRDQGELHAQPAAALRAGEDRLVVQ
jgi:hypothetical protein